MSFDAIALTIFNQNGSDYGVTWQTEAEGKPFLEYTYEEDLNFQYSIKIPAVMSPSTGTVKNCAEIRGLRPGEKCRYRVGDEEYGVSDDAVFTAVLRNPDKADFVVLADTQSPTHEFAFVGLCRNDILSRYPQTEFWIHGGDIVEHSYYAPQWAAFFRTQSLLSRTKPILPVAGNHEYQSKYIKNHVNTLQSHININLTPQDTRYGIYYSFDDGPVHFTMLSTGDKEITNGGLLDSQIEWLTKDLLETEKEWKIVVLHNPLYSPGRYGSSPWEFQTAIFLREQLNKIFSELKVDLVISAHDHVYSETYPIDAQGNPLTDTVYKRNKIDGIDAAFAINPKGPIHFQPFEAGGRVGDSVCKTNFLPFRRFFDKYYNISGYAHITAEHGKLSIITRIFNNEGLFKHFAFGIKKSSGRETK